MKKVKGDSTRCIHDGVEREKPFNTITNPIIHNAPYTFKDSTDLDNYMFQRVWGGQTNGRSEYARDGNPGILAVEKRLAALEGADEALLFASGMNAYTTLLISTLKSDDHIILTDDCYRHSREFCETYLKGFGVDITIVPTGDYTALENATQEQTKYIISESPTNPYLFIVDFERIAAIAKSCGAKTIIDSTFGTPLNHQPIKHGIDFVWHSATKYLGGHH
ncbi:MAG: aminotransferase class I/II-fold pyridoxal phosphate-dependent enzyme, partial [Aggregatilineales bacterium]